MLTDKPPKRIRAKPKAAALPARIVVGAKTETTSAEEHARRGEAADRLWCELVRAATGQGKPPDPKDCL